jgi:hypothetical protein
MVVAVAHPKVSARHPSWARLAIETLKLANALPDDPAWKLILIQIAPP